MDLNSIRSEIFQFFIEMIKRNTGHAEYFFCCPIIGSLNLFGTYV